MESKRAELDGAVDARGVWRSLDGVGVAVWAGTTVAAGALVYSGLTWGPCLGDPGEVQLTAALGAVGHPPGHGGVISILRAFVLAVPFWRADLVVVGVNGAFGVAVVSLLALVMLRSGAHPLAASAASLLFLVDDQFWHLATTPETYATLMLLLMGSAWAFLSWLHEPLEADRGGWKLWVAVGLYLFLVANRGPTLCMAVAFVGAMAVSRKGRAFWSSRMPRRVLAVVGIGVACVTATWGSVWVRDAPGGVYNYLDSTHPYFPKDYPASNVEAGDKARRLWWLVSARQFDYMFEPTWETVGHQARWVLMELGWRYWPVMVGAFGVMGLGAVDLWRRNRAVGVFVLLMTAGAVVPILLIRVVSHTAMLPNALAPLAWLFAMGLTRVLSMSGAVMWKAGVLAGIGLCVWVMGGNRLAPVDECFEVGAYLPEYDLNSLPEGAMVLSDATRMAPLLLKRMVLGRDDVVIVLESQWRRREGGAEGGRAVFAATAPEDEDVENREGAMVGGFYRLGGGLSGE